jgi:hypothetical protein
VTPTRPSRSEFRFGALSADGARASATYKVWRASAGDIYITHRSMGRHLKVSMHVSGVWKVEDYTSGRRSTWGPTEAVMDQGVPAVRILLPGGGLTAYPPDDPDLDSIAWAQFEPGTRAVEYILRLHPLTAEQPYVSPPGETVVPRTFGTHRGRHVLLSMLWRDRLPIQRFTAWLGDEYRDGFTTALDEVRAGRATMSWWGVTAQSCLVIDTIVPTDVVDD